MNFILFVDHIHIPSCTSIMLPVEMAKVIVGRTFLDTLL